MKRSALIILLVVFTGIASAGEWVFRPDGNGAMRISNSVGVSEAGPDMLVQSQLAGESLSVQIVAAGEGRCENGVLSGRGALESVHIVFEPVVHGIAQTAQRVKCGELFQFDSPSQAQFSGVKAVPKANLTGVGGLSSFRISSRVLIGHINFINAAGTGVTNSVYLDLDTVRNETTLLSAAFDRPAVSFGAIDVQRNTNHPVKLSVSKTAAASSEVIQYALAFESAQVEGNSFRLKSTTGDTYVPYQIKIADTSIEPGKKYSRTVSAGNASVDIVEVNFYLVGKYINGLKAGTRLMDTVTAVITPES